MKHGILLALATGAALVAATTAQAQITSAQQSAIRASCRSDFMSHCSGVTPGGKDALVCLQKNVGRLSGACQSAVRATMPAPAAAKAEPAAQTMAPAAAAPPPPPAATVTVAPPPKAAVAAPPPPRHMVKPAAAVMHAPTAEQRNAMRAACRNDFMAKCAGVQPGGKDALVCLQRHATTLSPACRKVVAATMGATAPVAAAVPAVATPVAGPDPAKLKALKFTCRADFRRLCKHVPAGPQAFACLEAHRARLSPNCRTSVADLAASMPAGAMPAAMPVAVKPAPVPHRPKAPVIDAAVVFRACKLDVIRHCRGAGLGGGRLLACLTAHEDSLTFRCRAAMKVSSPLH